MGQIAPHIDDATLAMLREAPAHRKAPQSQFVADSIRRATDTAPGI